MSDNVCTDNFSTVTRHGNSTLVPKGGTAGLNAPLKLAILESGLLQMDIAKRCGIHFSKLSLIVRGWRKPAAWERSAIASVLGRSEDELFGVKVA